MTTGFEVLIEDEALLVNGGDAKEIFTNVVGGCGAVAGAASGFLAGFTAAGNIFTTPVSVTVGVVTGVGGGAAGYYSAKGAASDAWDYLFGE